MTMIDNNVTLIERPDYWELSICGREVTRCLIDYGFSLEFWVPDNLVTVRIGGPFNLKVDGRAYALEPEKFPTGLGPALSILHATVEVAVAHKDGRLALTFSNGTSLVVPADPDFEAWEVSGPAGLLLVCTPGGDLAIWHPEQSGKPTATTPTAT